MNKVWFLTKEADFIEAKMMSIREMQQSELRKMRTRVLAALTLKSKDVEFKKRNLHCECGRFELPKFPL